MNDIFWAIVGCGVTTFVIGAYIDHKLGKVVQILQAIHTLEVHKQRR